MLMKSLGVSVFVILSWWRDVVVELGPVLDMAVSVRLS